MKRMTHLHTRILSAILLASPLMMLRAQPAPAPSAVPTTAPAAAALTPEQQTELDAAAKQQAKLAVEAAVKEAHDAHRRVLVRIVSPKCGWCKRLAKTLSEDETLRTTLASHYVLVDVQWKDRDCGAFGSESLKVPSIPYLLILDEKGAILARQKTDPFELNGGYDTPKLNEFFLKNAAATGADIPKNAAATGADIPAPPSSTP